MPDTLRARQFWLTGYTYGAGNPVTMVDPDGHWPDWGAVGRGLKNFGRKVGSWLNQKVGKPVRSGVNAVWDYLNPRSNPYVVVAPAPRRPRHTNGGRSGGSRSRGGSGKATVAVYDSRSKWKSTKGSGRPRGGGSGYRGGSRTSMKQQQVRARAAAAARARQRQAHVRAIVAQRAAAHNKPLPVSGELAAPLVATTAQSEVHGGVVADQAFARGKPWRERMKDAADQLAQGFLDASESTWRHVKDFGHAAGRFMRDNKGLFIGIGVTAAIVGGCAVAGVMTGGLATLACLGVAGVIGGGVGAAIDCRPGQSQAACIAIGAGAGAITALIPGGGSIAGGFLAKMVGGGLLGAGSAGLDGFIRTGRVSGTSLGVGGLLGTFSGGRVRRVPKPAAAGARSACGNSFTGGTGVVMADGSSRPIRDVRVGDMVRTVDEESGRDRGAVREVVSTISKRGVRKVVVLSLAVVAAGSAVTPAAAATAADSASTSVAGVSVARDSGGSAPAAKQSDAAKKLAGSDVAKRVVLEPTANHPFFVVDGKRWVDAGELSVGDRVALAGGGVARVESSVVESRFVRVHNLTVDRDHTFLVTQAAGPGGVRPKAGGVNPSTAVVVHNSTCTIGGEKIVMRNGGLAEHTVTGARVPFANQMPQFHLTTESDELIGKNVKPALYRVQIDPSGSRADHFRRANAVLREQGLPSNRDYTWHHDFVSGEMVYVHRRLHSRVAHTGGARIWGPKSRDAVYVDEYNRAVQNPAGFIESY